MKVSALLLLLLNAATPTLSAARRDPRLNAIAQSLESDTLAPMFDSVSHTDWTRSVLQGLSHKDRLRLAKLVRKAKSPVIRQATVEQYRVEWRSEDLPDSEFVVSFPMNARPGDLSKPMISFSSRVENIPTLLADALEKNQMPVLLSFHQPLSPWLETLPKLTPDERKKMLEFYHSLKLVENREEERLYKGPYVTADGLLVQNTLRLALDLNGRWFVQ